MTKPVLLIRADGNEPDAEALSNLGIESVTDPFIVIEKSRDEADAQMLVNAIANAEANTWLIATSVNAIRCLAELVGLERLQSAASNPNLRFAAVGDRTARSLIDLGARAVVTPEVADSESLAETLLTVQDQSLEQRFTAIIPSGLLAMKGLPNTLDEAGWNLITGVVYTTITKPSRPDTADRAAEGQYSAVIFRSPSAARAFLSFVPKPSMPLVAAGFTTAKVIEDAGLVVASIPSNPTPKSVASAVESLLKGE